MGGLIREGSNSSVICVSGGPQRRIPALSSAAGIRMARSFIEGEAVTAVSIILGWEGESYIPVHWGLCWSELAGHKGS